MKASLKSIGAFIAIVLVLVAIPLVLSATRIISYSSDSKESLVWNTNGRYAARLFLVIGKVIVTADHSADDLSTVAQGGKDGPPRTNRPVRGFRRHIGLFFPTQSPEELVQIMDDPESLRH